MTHPLAITAPLPPTPALATEDPPYQDGVLRLPGDLRLDGGQILHQPKIAWRLVGTAGAPVILALGGISASRLAWQPANAAPGWWQNLIGPAKALDTRHYRILTIDWLGGNGASESPRNSSLSGCDFPAISSRDQARAIDALLTALGIEQLTSAIGSSYGGMVALALGESFAARVAKLLVICGAHAAWPLATGWRHIQRELVKFALRHNDPETGLKLARALAMTTYRSGLEFAQRFAPGFDQSDASECVSYLEHCGETFSRIFDPYAFLCLSRSIDGHRVDPKQIKARVDLLGFASDQLVPVAQLEELRASLAESGRLFLSDSLYGHDAFLLEDALMTQEIQLHLEAR